MFCNGFSPPPALPCAPLPRQLGTSGVGEAQGPPASQCDSLLCLEETPAFLEPQALVV